MHHIELLDMSASDADLDFLGHEFERASFIGIGEATHGTSEFFRLRNRMIRYLVERAGCRLIGLEAGWAETYALHRVVFDGVGDAATAIARLGYWMWDVWEFRSLVDWLRSFNVTRPRSDRVSIFGFDARSGAAAVDLVVESLDPYSDRLSPVYSHLLEESRFLQAWQTPDDGIIEAERFAQVLEQLSDAIQAIPLDGTAHHLALAAIVQLQQVDRLRRAESGPVSWNLHDQGMADVISREIQRQSQRGPVVALAHNAHIAKDGRGLFAPGLAPMGIHLAEQMGDRYISIGQMFGQGTFQAMVATESGGYQLKEVAVGAPPHGSLDWQLQQVAMDKTVWVDVHNNALRTGSAGRVVTRECGAVFSTEEDLQLAISIADRHDAVVFSPVTTASHQTGARNP